MTSKVICIGEETLRHRTFRELYQKLGAVIGTVDIADGRELVRAMGELSGIIMVNMINAGTTNIEEASRNLLDSISHGVDMQAKYTGVECKLDFSKMPELVGDDVH